MMDATKYFTLDELKKIKAKRLAEGSMKILSNDEVYSQSLIEGGVGVDPTIKHMIDVARGEDNGHLQMYHGVSSSGMQAI